jgi:acyl-CoA synthetase (NDP forming)
MKLLGPNCLGVVSVVNRFFATFSTALEALTPSPGTIAIATQSGAFGSCAYSIAIQRNMGLSRIVATGNEAHIDVAECIDYFAQDPGTKVICAAIEGCQDGNRLRAALLKAAQNNKPVIIMKVGTSTVGIAAAATHTGSLAGNDAIYDAIFAECGAWRAQTIEEMLDVAYFCSKLPVPKNDQAGIVTVSGGIGILMADAAETHSIALPELPPAAVQKMVELLPFAPIGNPLDTTAQVTAVKDGTTRTMEIILTETQWSTLFLYMAQSACAPKRFESMRMSLIALKQRHPERSLILIGPSDDAVRLSLENDGFIVMTDPTRAVVAAHACMTLAQRRKCLVAVPPRRDVAPKLQQIQTEVQAKQLLAKHGIPSLQERICATRSEAITAANALGMPVVVKILSPDIQHKTEIGGVVLNLTSEQAVADAFDLVTQRALTARPDARIEGVLVSQMAGPGVETILGVHQDPVFGPMIMFGLGGISVELFKDVAFASAPLSQDSALALIKRVRASRLLTGWRGQAPYDQQALVDALVALSNFALTYSDHIEGVDINPFLVQQKGAVCLDALITIRA